MLARTVFLGAALGATALLGACGGDDDDDDSAATATTQGVTGAVDGASLKVSESSKFGPILTTPDGLTLYIFTQDAPGKSNCNDACAATWPPLTATSSRLTKPEGVKGELSMVTRDDGSRQIALDGKPLYRYAPDKAAGDTGGEGIGGVWFVAKADGTTGPATGSANQTPAPGSGDAYGY